MENNISGHFMYQGLYMTQQIPEIKTFFEFLLRNENFDTIIEIGTSLGGLTLIIDDVCIENNLVRNIHTFDYNYKDFVDNNLKDRGISYYNMDEKTDEFIVSIKNLISTGDKVLLLCDGGDKISEFNYYSEFIKKNDFIMAHDYSTSKEIFEESINKKIWNWFEIQYTDIKDSINTNNLIEYPKINFKDAAWACFLKT
jgi:cephalosporin hydroxylase